MILDVASCADILPSPRCWGRKDYLTSPKTVCQGGFAKDSTVLFFINDHSHLKMTTSPVKLCLLPTPTPSALRSRLYVSIKGVSWDFKTRWTSVYFPLLPAPTGTNVFHFDLISLLIFNVAQLSGLPMRFPRRGCAQFLLTTFGCRRPRSEQLNCLACYCRISRSRKAHTRRYSKCYKAKLIARLLLRQKGKI